MLKVLDLFSGIGGFSLGLEKAGGFETIAFSEKDSFCCSVLNKHWPTIPICQDIKLLNYIHESTEPDDWLLIDEEINSEIYRGPINIITGGFPCQDISVAGKQAGIEGERSGLWSECARLLGEIRPDYAIFENVTALLSGDNGQWFQRVLFDISALGYNAEWHCIPASELGAHHHRDRVWIICYPEHAGRDAAEISESDKAGNGSNTKGQKPTREFKGPGYPEILADAGGPRLQKPQQEILCGPWWREKRRATTKRSWWATEPGMGRVAHGIPGRVDKLKALGNSLCPQIPELIGMAILEYDKQKTAS